LDLGALEPKGSLCGMGTFYKDTSLSERQSVWKEATGSSCWGRIKGKFSSDCLTRRGAESAFKAELIGYTEENEDTVGKNYNKGIQGIK